ncbi:hypothetical protein [Nodosilinea nodulosa]|uniref:hypothetical protein n=1 Tax=Nodosilinea nodulosa TaxID=416001 RepID=UPI00035C0F8E|nr:hypothetical protein [Nodosilinea nodulosa]
MQLIDPITGEVRPAGSFSSSEWQNLVRENPDAATLILQLRRKEKDAEEARRESLRANATSVGALAAGASFPAINAAMPNLGNAFAKEWIVRGHAVPGSVIYEGPRVGISVSDRPENYGQTVFTVDGSTERPYNPRFSEDAFIGADGKPLTGGAVDARRNKLIRDGNFDKDYLPPERPREIVDDIGAARTNWTGYQMSPEGARLYMATPEAAGVFGGSKGVERLAELGFSPSTLAGNSIYTMDARPGARFLGSGYHLVDDLVMKAAQGQSLKPVRFAGALIGALGLGGAIAQGINILGDRTNAA